MFSAISARFESNLESIFELMTFDRVVLNHCIEQIEKLQVSLGEKINPLHVNKIEMTLGNLKQIQKHGSLRSQYQAINNQGVVLLVSHFGSALSDLFKLSVHSALRKETFREINRAEVKLSLASLMELDQKSELIAGELIIDNSANTISFQDMKSTKRAFSDYFGIKIEKEPHVNDIILAQACRHSIVHEGARITSRLINQIRQSKPRTLKLEIEDCGQITFDTEELRVVARSMRLYLKNLTQQLTEALTV
jgi:hypothetical protein